MSAEKDNIIIELFASLRELSQLRRKYDSHIREGYVNLAKARYDIGARTGGIISQLQYPCVMEATTHIQCHDNDHQHSFELCIYSNQATKTDEPMSSQVRQRKGTVPTNDRVTSPPPSLIGNPIRWFSILPPMALRQSQHQFRQGIEVAIMIVNVQIHIEELRNKFQQLLSCNNIETITPIM